MSLGISGDSLAIVGPPCLRWARDRRYQLLLCQVTQDCRKDTEQCLGEDHHKIQKWISNGWLRDRLQGTRRHDGNGHDVHRFSEKDILAFIKQHPQEINLDKVDGLWFLDMVLLRGREMGEAYVSRAGASDDSEEAA